jgi:opacity protein-like surface antigen
MRNALLVLLFLLPVSIVSYAQADKLMDELNDGVPVKGEKINATFKATRIIDGTSVENLGAGVLDFRISHRFGQINQGYQNFYGLDNATTRIGLDYGIKSWLMVGIGHSAFNKDVDGSLKLKLLAQKTTGMPITLSFASSISAETQKTPTFYPSYENIDSVKVLFSDRLCYTSQLLIGRKFSERLSLQLSPTWVHYNIVESSTSDNNTFALGMGGRFKLTKRMAITAEYFYRLNNTNLQFTGMPTYNSFSLGIDIETGGHVFQLMVTNSQGLTDRTFIGETTDSWNKGALHVGFNVSRVFTVVKPKGFKANDEKAW